MEVSPELSVVTIANYVILSHAQHMFTGGKVELAALLSIRLKVILHHLILLGVRRHFRVAAFKVVLSTWP